ncbi:carbohydrate ABC transporter permease [Cellulomonas xiejunii]|uniref:Carbohydrate ABC transporter permease n=1 Tax=Cellulomonas xiejunii TaxID=2968083 RepID=A0ABY5KX68_9CELL|nr:carbohydrate ABC transporter permease [Cellulomonas xiejunii]MCC2315218.1 carbohydrate ABC transporter permease [Cellulomonas xiejunii]MCC2321639.1 carbohydrate ABC transporter permease [Cellulomonas xiejunii]UUI72953.1 carbohydrate ABC transporter permease [Cellulomonas xiejunii]
MTSVVAPPSRGSRGAARSGSQRRRSVSPWVYVASVLVAGITLAPVVYAVLSGFRSNGQLGANPVGLPNPWIFTNYTGVLTSGSFWQYALNSVIIAGVTTAIVVVAGVMAAYPLARYRFKGRQALFNVFVIGLMFPLTVAIIPLFLMVRDLQLTNTYWGVALPQAAFALPMTIVILRPFLMALPNELEEAAMLDGASRIGFFWRILIPLSGPGMVTTGVLAFVGSWNGYLLPLLLLNDPKLKTLPLGVADFSTQYSADTAGVLAFTSLAVIPALVFFLTMQKRIVSGLQGAVKG